MQYCFEQICCTDCKYLLYFYDKWEEKRTIPHCLVRTVPKSNQKIVERRNIDTRDRWHYWLIDTKSVSSSYYWYVCTKPDKWVITYMCVRSIDFYWFFDCIFELLLPCWLCFFIFLLRHCFHDNTFGGEISYEKVHLSLSKYGKLITKP